MKYSRFTDSQIMVILKQADGGTPVTDLCREHGMKMPKIADWLLRLNHDQ